VKLLVIVKVTMRHKIHHNNNQQVQLTGFPLAMGHREIDLDVSLSSSPVTLKHANTSHNDLESLPGPPLYDQQSTSSQQMALIRLRRTFLLGGCPLLLILGMVQLVSPSAIIPRKSFSIRKGTEEPVPIHARQETTRGWAQKLQRDGVWKMLEELGSEGFEVDLFPSDTMKIENIMPSVMNFWKQDDGHTETPRMENLVERNVSEAYHEGQQSDAASVQRPIEHHRQLRVRQYPEHQPGYATNADTQQYARPIIHTFYTRIAGKKETGMTDDADQELLNAWKDEWTRHGWEPRVIGIETAQQHPDYGRLNAILEGLTMKTYDRYCFLRWLAMSVVSGGWMSDYDTFPLHQFLPTLPNQGRLTVHEHSKNGGVPSLVSGSGAEYHRLAAVLIENAWNHKADIWSDMFALHDVYVASGGTIYMKDGHVVPGQVITKHTRSDRICKRTYAKYAVHFSHYAMDFGGTEGAKADDRSTIALRWLKEWRGLCLSDASEST
jgi:hypothetical protein